MTGDTGSARAHHCLPDRASDFTIARDCARAQISSPDRLHKLPPNHLTTKRTPAFWATAELCPAGATSNLNWKGKIVTTIDRNRLLDKIRALLSKTTENGCTEAEHLAALDKAYAMIDAYEVTPDDLRLTKTEAAVLRKEPRGTLDPHNIKWFLVSAVSNRCGVKGWRCHKIEGRVFEFCGMESDVQFAIWLLDHLAAFVQSELAQHLMGSVAPRGERRFLINDFVSGSTSRIRSRIEESIPREVTLPSNSRALVVVKGAAIGDRMKKAGIRLVKRPSQRRVDPTSSSYRAGQAAGDRASFGRPVSGAATQGRIGR
jgi:Protein of unknown function (DUF2786)